MNTVAFIFARGGSKGLPGKNLRPLGGKPLIAWSICHAQSVKRIERVIVSTDCEEIASVASQYGADVPFMRPEKLAEDDSPEWLAWQHGLNYLHKVNGGLPEIMVSIPVTAPLRQPLDIENCLDEFMNGDADIVVTITDAHRNPYFNMVKIRDNGSLELVSIPNTSITRRQDAPVCFDMGTICYVARPEFILNNNSIFDGKVKGVHVPKERAIDIDTVLDFKIAEMLFEARGSKPHG